MPEALSAVRNTCFAILSAIEVDVRHVVEAECERLNINSPLPLDVRRRAVERLLKDPKRSPGAEADKDLDVLEYTDFTDLAKILNMHSEVMFSDSMKCKFVADELAAMGSARNRVCHSRLLEDDDFARFVDLSETLLTSCPELEWTELREVNQKRKADPSSIFRLDIPAFWRVTSDDASHNLPLPDFDETGFLGRGTDRKEILKHLNGAHRVVTIVGEGGVGKTALALSCAYALLDMPKNQQFDCIVWVSLKARVLTVSGVREIRDAVASTLGLMQTAVSALGSLLAQDTDLDSLIAELHDFMSTLKVLLVIDNLETLPTDHLRQFLTAIPEQSKVFITSRVGLGEFEVRYKLDSLDQKTAATLFRRYARSLNVDMLYRAKDDLVLRYVSKLFFSPLLIKWFVSSVSNGGNPSTLLDGTDGRFSDAIRFCFENLYRRLSPVEQEILSYLAVGRRVLTQAELMFLMQEVNTGQMGQLEVEVALTTLHNSSMVRRSLGDSLSGSVHVALTDIASEYLTRVSPPSKETVVSVKSRLRNLQELADRSIVKRAAYKYDIYAVRVGSRDERIAGAYLQFALHAMKSKKYEEARKRVEQARTMQPGWSESYRILAIVEDRALNVSKALESLEIAIELDPNSSVLLYQYALYLFYTVEDPETALDALEKALQLDEGDETLSTLKALVLMRLQRPQEAAVLYEEVLGTIANRPRKWRIPTRDQAAECYRRWAQIDRDMRDFTSALAHAERGLEVLREGIGKGDFDYKSVARYSHVIEDAFESGLLQGDRSVILWGLNHLVDAPFEGILTHFRRVTLEEVHYFSQGDEELLAALHKLTIGAPSEQGLALAASNDLEEFVGVIKSTLDAKKFGFITDKLGVDWFFHEAFLASGRWQDFRTGQRVRFRKGESKGRVCAVNIYPL